MSSFSTQNARATSCRSGSSSSPFHSRKRWIEIDLNRRRGFLSAWVVYQERLLVAFLILNDHCVLRKVLYNKNNTFNRRKKKKDYAGENKRERKERREREIVCLNMGRKERSRDWLWKTKQEKKKNVGRETREKKDSIKTGICKRWKGTGGTRQQGMKRARLDLIIYIRNSSKLNI